MPEVLPQHIEVSPITTLRKVKQRTGGTGRKSGRPKKYFFEKQTMSFKVFMDLQEYSLASVLLQLIDVRDLPELCRLLMKEEAVRRTDELRVVWANQHSTIMSKEGDPEE